MVAVYGTAVAAVTALEPVRHYYVSVGPQQYVHRTPQRH